MTVAFIIAVIIAGIFYLLWQEEREKRALAEDRIKQLNKKLAQQKKQNPPQKRKTEPVVVEKAQGVREYIIRKPEPQPPKPLLDQKKLAELQEQTKVAQDILAEIFVPQEESAPAPEVSPDKGPMMHILEQLLFKEVWTRAEIAELAGPDVMIGSLLEQINDYSCSKINDIVLEEDGDEIFVTTEYRDQLI